MSNTNNTTLTSVNALDITAETVNSTNINTTKLKVGSITVNSLTLTELDNHTINVSENITINGKAIGEPNGLATLDDNGNVVIEELPYTNSYKESSSTMLPTSRALANGLSNEALLRNELFNTVNQNVTVFGTKLDSEIVARTAADESLSNSISTYLNGLAEETTNRINGDDDLNTRIDDETDKFIGVLNSFTAPNDNTQIQTDLTKFDIDNSGRTNATKPLLNDVVYVRDSSALYHYINTKGMVLVDTTDVDDETVTLTQDTTGKIFTGNLQNTPSTAVSLVYDIDGAVLTNNDKVITLTYTNIPVTAPANVEVSYSYNTTINLTDTNSWQLYSYSVNPKFVQYATEKTKGLTKIATQKEVDGAVNNLKYVTPYTLRKGLNNGVAVLDDDLRIKNTYIVYNADSSLISNSTVENKNSIAYWINVANGSNATIHLTKGIYAITTSLTVPSNICLDFDEGAILSIADNITLTLNCDIKSGAYKLFELKETTSKVSGQLTVDYIYPEWFGAVGDGETYDTKAIQLALDLASVSGMRIKFLPVTYRIDSTLYIDCNGDMIDGTISGNSANFTPFILVGGNNTDNYPTINNVDLALPKLNNETKPTEGGWANCQTGLEFGNCSCCNFVVPSITNFGNGILIDKQFLNNHVKLEKIYSNKININITTNTIVANTYTYEAKCNNNIFYGGKIGYNTTDAILHYVGDNIINGVNNTLTYNKDDNTCWYGTRNIAMYCLTNNVGAYGNVFIGQDLSSTTVEYNLELNYASYNDFYNLNYSGNRAKELYFNHTLFNSFYGGYEADQVNITNYENSTADVTGEDVTLTGSATIYNGTLANIPSGTVELVDAITGATLTNNGRTVTLTYDTTPTTAPTTIKVKYKYIIKDYGTNLFYNSSLNISKSIASETVAGIVRLATADEVAAGTEDKAVLTPASIQNMIATENRYGVIKIASENGITSGNDNTAITPYKFNYCLKNIGSLFSSTFNGLTPKTDGVTDKFLKSDGTWSNYTAANGIQINGTVITHTNSLTSGGVGSSSSIPVITWDNQGHLTSVGSVSVQTPSNLVLKINSGTTEGTNLYTFNGSIAKTLNIVAGNDITLTPTAGTLTIASTDTTYTAGSGLTLTGTVFSHSNSVTAGTVGSNVNIPSITYDAQGHIISTSAITISAGDNITLDTTTNNSLTISSAKITITTVNSTLEITTWNSTNQATTGYYTYTISNSNIKTTSTLILNPDIVNISNEQLSAYNVATIYVGTISDGSVELRAYNTLPTVNIPVVIKIFN
jgi:hypothetical protein